MPRNVDQSTPTALAGPSWGPRPRSSRMAVRSSLRIRSRSAVNGGTHGMSQTQTAFQYAIPQSTLDSNNVETLQSSRGKNFRHQIPSSEATSHSEEPGMGAPGRAASSDQASASDY